MSRPSRMSAAAFKAMHAQFRLGASAKPAAKRDEPEHRLQVAVTAALDELWRLGRLRLFDWTASLAGVRLTPKVRVKAKAAGLRPGWPDLQFACWDGLTRYIELKADGDLSPAQRLFRDYAQPLGIWALCRSVGEVIDQLTAWGLIGPVAT